MNSCVFCKINVGKLPASWVYRDNMVTAFMDIQPVNEGHTLLVPTAHTPGIADLDDATSNHLFSVARRITDALYKTLECDGVNWIAADGEAAGQEVFHFHLHLIPRRHNDGFGFQFPENYSELPTHLSLDRTASAIKDAFEGNRPDTDSTHNSY